MAALTSILAVSALVLSAAGAGYSMYAADKQADAEQDAKNKEAKHVIEAGQDEADQIRRRALILGKSQEAALAGSGVEIGSGTAGALTEETNRLAEEDIFATLKESRRRASALRAGGDLAQSTARSRNIGTGINWFSSAVGTGYSAYQSSSSGSGSSGSGLKSTEVPAQGNLSPWGRD